MGAIVDVVATADSIEAGLAAYEEPAYPCSLCGKETKEHQPVLDGDGNVTQERRICSDAVCREVINV